MTAIKEYVEMGYLKTFAKYGDIMKVYSLPRKVCERVMGLKNLSKEERPQVVDLTEYGYGFESISMIRGAERYNKTEGSVEYFILSLSEEGKERARVFVEQRKEQHLVTTYETMKTRCEKNSIS